MIKDEVVIPQTYDEWRHCIEVLCKIELTHAYVKERLAVMQNDQNAKTKKFAKLYGKEHLRRIIEWFRLAENDLSDR